MDKSICILWDDLPVDTVIASILDPRTKFFDRIPKKEINEALKIMAKVQSIIKILLKDSTNFKEISDMNQGEYVEEKNKNPFSDLFESRPKNKKNKWSDELDRYRIEERLDMDQDPLLWWKLNKCRYPLLGKFV